MKERLLSLFLAVALVAFASNADINGKKIMIDPGHGGWTSNDRNLATINHALGDTNGFYESNTNLWKGLYMGYKLSKAGATVYYSRTKNGTSPALSTVAAQANSYGVDAFVSIHSNAYTEGGSTNYTLILYKGVDNNPDNAGSNTIGAKIWPQHFNNPIDTHTAYSSTQTNLRGCRSYYGGSDLTVLDHSRPGVLIEGYFHTYQPARHRALNKDYCNMEGLRIARGLYDYFGGGHESVGAVVGTVKDASNSLEHALYTYVKDGIDSKAPINGATVKLYRRSDNVEIASYTTDQEYNGVFVFKDVQPGEYYVKATKKNYTESTSAPFTVTANQTSYPTLFINAIIPDQPAKVYVYAYDLRKRDDGKDWIFSYKVNDNITGGKLVCIDQNDGDRRYEFDITGYTPCTDHEIVVPKTALPKSNKIKWEIYVEGTTPANRYEKVYDESCKDTGRAGMTIDNSPESPYFSNLYYVASNKNNNDAWLNVLHPNGTGFARVVAPKAPTTNQMNMLKDIHTDYKGNLYFSGVEMTGTNQGVWMFDMEKLYNNTFATKAHPISDHMVQTFSIFGTGADQKVVTDEYDYSNGASNKMKIRRYDIGDRDGTSSWSVAKSFEITTVSNSYRTHIQGDPHGTMWFSQRKATQGQAQANQDGIQGYDFNGGKTFGRGEHSMNYSGMVVDTKRSVLYYLKDTGAAYARDDQTIGTVNTISVSWNGVTPSIDYSNMQQITMTESGVVPTKMAVDYAGNAYLYASNHIYRIVRGGMANECTTPCRTAEIIDNSVIDESYPEHLYVFGTVCGYNYDSLQSDTSFECYNAGNGIYYTTVTRTGDGDDDGWFDFSSNPTNHLNNRYGPTVATTLPAQEVSTTAIRYKGSNDKAYRLPSKGVYYVEIDLGAGNITVSKRTTGCGDADWDKYSPKLMYILASNGASGFSTSDRTRPVGYKSDSGLLSGVVYIPNHGDTKNARVILTTTPGSNWDLVKLDRYSCVRSTTDGVQTCTLNSNNVVTTDLRSSRETYWEIHPQSGGEAAGYYKVSMNFSGEVRGGVPAHSIRFEKLSNDKVYLYAPSGCAFQNHDGEEFKELKWQLNYLKLDEEFVGGNNNKFYILDHGTMRYANGGNANVTNARRGTTDNSMNPLLVDSDKSYTCIVYDKYNNDNICGAKTVDGVDYSVETVKSEPASTSSNSFLQTQPETFTWTKAANQGSVTRFYVMDANDNELFFTNTASDFVTQDGKESISLYGLYNRPVGAAAPAYVVVEQLANFGVGDVNMREINIVPVSGVSDKLDQAYFAQKFKGSNLVPVNSFLFDQRQFPGRFGTNISWSVAGSTLYPAYYNIYYIDRNANPTGYGDNIMKFADFDGDEASAIQAKNGFGVPAESFISGAADGYVLNTQWEYGSTTPYSAGNPVTIEFIMRPKFLVYNPTQITTTINIPIADTSVALASAKGASTKAATGAWTDFSQFPSNPTLLGNVARVSGADFSMSVVYDENTPTGVETVVADGAKVYGGDGEIVLDGVTGKVTVVTEGGAVKTVVPMASGGRFAIPQSAGMYLVLFNNKAVKVIVK